MATQHPDNARVPSWVNGQGVIAGDDEVTEAYLAFSELGVQEVMWDSEGKDVDTHVVRKLLTQHPEYFRDYVLGRDVFLTYRLPNPSIEGVDRKVFAETLESIPITYDVAERFYGEGVTTPVFEVILPFTTGFRELEALVSYYEKAVAGKEDIRLTEELTVRDIIGEFRPKKIAAIPLIEDMQSMLGINGIIEPFIKKFSPPYMRVFLARSDPAMNYGMVPAVLMVKIALNRLQKISEKFGIRIYPIIGVGSLPFRGGFSPVNVQGSLEEYKGVWTFTVQSAFRYDYPQDTVSEAIRLINYTKPSEPDEVVNEEALVSSIKKLTERYQREVESMASLINAVSVHIPKRRARKLHIGLFGYSRSTGHVVLPRAITFVASLYSIGLPPELLGLYALDGLKNEEWNAVITFYKRLTSDLKLSLRYFRSESLNDLVRFGVVPEETANMIMEDVRYAEEVLNIKPGPDDYDSVKHRLLSELVVHALKEKRESELKEIIKEMALLRRSLG